MTEAFEYMGFVWAECAGCREPCAVRSPEERALIPWAE
jgi:hypothetical protein